MRATTHQSHSVLPKQISSPTQQGLGFRNLRYLKLFFISRSFPITLIGSVSPVTFWISGSYVSLISVLESWRWWRVLREGEYLQSHEDVPCLFIGDGGFSGRYFISFAMCNKILNRFRGRHRLSELCVGKCIFVARLWLACICRWSEMQWRVGT